MMYEWMENFYGTWTSQNYTFTLTKDNYDIFDNVLNMDTKWVLLTPDTLCVFKMDKTYMYKMLGSNMLVQIDPEEWPLIMLEKQ